MIRKITRKTVILSSPTTPHNKTHSHLFYFDGRKRLLLLLKLSHNLQPEKPPPPGWSLAEQLLKLEHKGGSQTTACSPLQLGQFRIVKRNTWYGKRKEKLLHLMKVGPVRLYLILGSKDRPSNAFMACV